MLSFSKNQSACSCKVSGTPLQVSSGLGPCLGSVEVVVKTIQKLCSLHIVVRPSPSPDVQQKSMVCLGDCFDCCSLLCLDANVITFSG